MTTRAGIGIGDTVRLLDRSGDVRGHVVAISTKSFRVKRPIKVELDRHPDSRFWFSSDELEPLRGNERSDD